MRFFLTILIFSGTSALADVPRIKLIVQVCPSRTYLDGLSELKVDNTVSEMDLLQRSFDEWDTSIPNFVERIRPEVLKTISSRRLISGIELTKPTGYTPDPGCEVKTLAVEISNPVLNKNEILINETLWKSLSENEKFYSNLVSIREQQRVILALDKGLSLGPNMSDWIAAGFIEDFQGLPGSQYPYSNRESFAYWPNIGLIKLDKNAKIGRWNPGGGWRNDRWDTGTRLSAKLDRDVKNLQAFDELEIKSLPISTSFDLAWRWENQKPANGFPAILSASSEKNNLDFSIPMFNDIGACRNYKLAYSSDFSSKLDITDCTTTANLAIPFLNDTLTLQLEQPDAHLFLAHLNTAPIPTVVTSIDLSSRNSTGEFSWGGVRASGVKNFGLGRDRNTKAIHSYWYTASDLNYKNPFNDVDLKCVNAGETVTVPNGYRSQVNCEKASVEFKDKILGAVIGQNTQKEQSKQLELNHSYVKFISGDPDDEVLKIDEIELTKPVAVNVSKELQFTIPAGLNLDYSFRKGQYWSVNDFTVYSDKDFAIRFMNADFKGRELSFRVNEQRGVVSPDLVTADGTTQITTPLGTLFLGPWSYDTSSRKNDMSLRFSEPSQTTSYIKEATGTVMKRVVVYKKTANTNSEKVTIKVGQIVTIEFTSDGLPYLML